MADDIAPTEPPARGSPESAAFFRAALAEIGETQASLARLMKRKGDDRQPKTILRNIQRMAVGEARVPGEMRVLLTMLRTGKEKAIKRAAARKDATPPPAGNKNPRPRDGANGEFGV
jgi:hypothetical protein